MDARDDLGLFRLVLDLPEIARKFERRLIGLGAGGREVGGGGVGVGAPDDLLGEPDRRLVGGADIGRGKGDPPHLRARRVGQLGPAVADIDVPQPRQPVDIFVAVGVAQHRALALDDDQRLTVVIGMVQRVDKVAPIGFEQTGGVHAFLLFGGPHSP